MFKQLLALSLITLVSCTTTKVSEVTKVDECIPTMEESCNPSGYTAPIHIDIKVKPNSCKVDCNFQEFEYHKGFSIDTYTHGKVWVQHGTLTEQVNVPKGHKLITCYCKQQECIIKDPSEFQYVRSGNLTGTKKTINKGGVLTLSVHTDLVK